MTTTQGEHAQTALAHELFAAAQLAPGEGIEDAVSRIAAALTAAPAQPAAPQGVAYAERPEYGAIGEQASAWMTIVHELDVACPGWTRLGQTGEEAAVAAIQKLASHGQAPAGATLFDEQGFRDWVLRNLPDDTIIGNGAWWAEHLTAWAKRFIKAATTAQAAPAAGAVAITAPSGMVPVAEVVECGTMGQQTLREIDGCWRWLSIGERVYAHADTGFIAAPTPATKADSVLEDAQCWRLIVDRLDEPNIDTVAHIRNILAARKQGAKHD